MTTAAAESAGRLLLELFLGDREPEDVDWRALLSDVFFQGYVELLPFIRLYRDELGTSPVVESFEVAEAAATMRVTGPRSSIAIAVTMTDQGRVGWIHVNRVGDQPTRWSDLLAETSITAVEIATVDPTTAGEISSLIGAVRSGSHYAGLALAAARSGETIYSASRGVAWLGAAAPPTSATPFRAGSVTKPVTALTVLRLADAGMIDLDAPITEALTSVEFIPFGESPTVRHLLDHQAGLPRGGPGDSTALRPLRTLLSSGVRFERPPGERFEYTNLGFGLLGLLIEDVTGLGYADAVARVVFDREGMANSSVSGGPPASPPAAQGYDVNSGLVLPTLEYFMADVAASGGLVTTTSDLLRLGAAILAEPKMWAAMPSGTEAVYASGLRLQAAPEHPFGFHNGMVPGARATLIVLPDDDLVVVGLANGGNEGLDGLVMRTARAILLG